MKAVRESSSDDTGIKTTPNEDTAADVIRVQGEEVIRLRKELEKAQRLNTTAFDFLRSTDEYMAEIQNTFNQHRMRLSFLEGTLVDLQRENAASSDTLKNMRADLQNFCGFLSSEQSSSHPVTQDNIVDERYKFSSISGSTRDESVMMDDLSTKVSITNMSTTDSDVELTKPIAQTFSSVKTTLDEPLRENNARRCSSTSTALSDHPDFLRPGGIPLEPVAPLRRSENRWGRKAISNVHPDSPKFLDRKVLGLLNKLTMEKFDLISDQIIAWANKSENEKNGRSLIHVICLVFGKVADEATWSEMYARLCRKMMEQISPKVQDDGMKNSYGKPVTGGHLFRKYLLNRCQMDFERGNTTAAAAARKVSEEESTLYSKEYYAAQKAKCQRLSVIKFMGELFKMRMLTERIMHECVKQLLANVENSEEEIESLCTLLATVGQMLDTPKARAQVDVYFSRMKKLSKNQNVHLRMKFMLQDLIELREREWQMRHRRDTVPAPTTIAKIHEAAAKEEAA